MIRISYTFLSAYKKCHKQAYLYHIKKVVDRSRVNHRPFMVGIVVDWLFTKWIEKEYPLGWMEESAEALFNWFANRRFIQYRHVSDKEQLIRKTENAARLLEEAAFEWELPKREIIPQLKVEFKGVDEWEGFEFIGRLDLWFPKEKLVWDLKITKNKKYLDDFQLRFFAWLLANTGETVKGAGFLTPLRSPVVSEVHLGYNETAEFEQELSGILLDIKNEKHWAATAKDCWNCPVRFNCEQDFSSSFEAKKKEDGGFEIRFKED